MDIMGLLPAAGKANRLHGLPKMLLPTADGFLWQRHVQLMAKVTADVRTLTNNRNYNILRDYTTDPTRLINVGNTDTMIETLLSKADDRNSVLFGMPDTYFEDDNAYVRLCQALYCGADVAVGVFPVRTDQRGKLGQVAIDSAANVIQIFDKQDDIQLEYAWGVVGWKPEFWQFLDPAHAHLGIGIDLAIRSGLKVKAVVMQGLYWDCGTADEYFKLCSSWTKLPQEDF